MRESISRHAHGRRPGHARDDYYTRTHAYLQPRSCPQSRCITDATCCRTAEVASRTVPQAGSTARAASSCACEVASSAAVLRRSKYAAQSMLSHAMPPAPVTAGRPPPPPQCRHTCSDMAEGSVCKAQRSNDDKHEPTYRHSQVTLTTSAACLTCANDAFSRHTEAQFLFFWVPFHPTRQRVRTSSTLVVACSFTRPTCTSWA